MTDVVGLGCLAADCAGRHPCAPPWGCLLRATLKAVRLQGEVPVVWTCGTPEATSGNRWIGALADRGLVEWERVDGGVIARACQVEGA